VSSYSAASTSRLKRRIKISSRDTPVVQKILKSELAEAKKKAKVNQQITDACHFLEDVNEAIEKYGAENVYNLDEKPVSGAPSSVSSFQIMGEPTENIHSIGSPNRIMTAVVNTSGPGGKLPILFLKKGKVKTCASYKAIKNNVSLYSNELDLTPKGWMNEPTMLKYLDLFIANIPHGPCAL